MPLFSGFTSFDEDPFFEGHQERLRSFSGYSPFHSGWFQDASTSRQQQLPQPSQTPSLRQQDQLVAEVPSRVQSHDLFSPFRCQDMVRDLTGQVNHMMRRMDDLAKQMVRLPPASDMEVSPDSHSYSSSSVYRYHNDGGQEPQTYEAHYSKRTAPGGVREERKALKDTARKLEKYSLGRHIHDRGHVVERTTDTATNETRHREDLHGMSELDVDRFKADWADTMSRFHGTPMDVEGGQSGMPAIKDKTSKQAKL